MFEIKIHLTFTKKTVTADFVSRLKRKITISRIFHLVFVIIVVTTPQQLQRQDDDYKSLKIKTNIFEFFFM